MSFLVCKFLSLQVLKFISLLMLDCQINNKLKNLKTQKLIFNIQ